MSVRMEIDEEIQMASNGNGDGSYSSKALNDENIHNDTAPTTDPEATAEGACQVKEDDEIDQEKGNGRAAQGEMNTKIDPTDMPDEACQVKEDNEIDEEKGNGRAAQGEMNTKIDPTDKPKEACQVKEDNEIDEEKGNGRANQGEMNTKIDPTDKPKVETQVRLLDPLEAEALDITISPEADALIRELNRDPKLMWEDPFQVDCTKTLSAYVKSIRRSDREEYELDLAERGLEQSIATYCARVDYTHQALCDLNAQLDALLDPSNYGDLRKPKTRHQYPDE